MIKLGSGIKKDIGYSGIGDPQESMLLFREGKGIPLRNSNVDKDICRSSEMGIGTPVQSPLLPCPLLP